MIAWRQRAQKPLKAGNVSSPAQSPTRAMTSSPSSCVVRRTGSPVGPAGASASAIAATTASVWLSLRLTPAIGAVRDERAESADSQRPSSLVATRWTVPRGPKVLTSSARSHSASRTVPGVAFAVRRPIASSAAENTWAWAPTIAETALAASGSGVTSPCRARRRAVTAPQLTSMRQL